jgi:hypothetical protein
MWPGQKKPRKGQIVALVNETHGWRDEVKDA